MGFIRGYGQDISLFQENIRSSLRSTVKENWRPPDFGVIKLNFDAAFQHASRLAVTAVISRDSEGEIVGAETYLLTDVGDACLAQARACMRALLFADMRGFRRLIIEGDYFCAPIWK